MTKTTMTAAAALVVGLGASMTAQDPQEMTRRREIELATQVMARTAVEARITPGAPYAAEAVTESTQQLADGNRIVKRSVTRTFRDSEGRTRREQLAANGVDVQAVNISDPVAQSTYVLIPENRTAFRNGVVIATPRGIATASVSPGGSGVVTAARSADGSVRVEAREATSEAERKATEEANGVTVARSGGAGAGAGAGAGGAVAAGGARGRGGAMGMLPSKQPGSDPGVREDLGQQTIEGVVATGTRVTTTIAAGAIGNEQPIKIVSEQWFSPELQVLVLTKHSDPRTGETLYRLTNIVRSEQARSLFEVPPDYTLKDSVIRRDMR